MTIDAGPETNPYLLGHHAPVTDELVATDLRVVGEIPAGLEGSYLRNGPNPAFAPLGRYHLFDGDGMLHSVELRDGKANYRNRYIESRGLQGERAAGHALYGGLAEFRIPDPEIVAEFGMMKNTANTNVVRHAGRTLALMEACPPIEIGPELTTLGEWNFDGKLQGAMTAHPKIDPATGELLFFGYSPFPPYVRFHVADADGNLVRSEAIDLPAPVMMHDFVVTERHVLFFDLPAIFDLDAMLSGGAGIRWDPANGARVGVLDRAVPGNDVTWIEIDPCYVFHFLNAHDDGDSIVVDGCRSDRLGIGFGPEDDLAGMGPALPVLHRWRIDVRAGTVKDEPLDERRGDFPRINDAFTGLPVRYGYLAHLPVHPNGDVRMDGVIKYDLERDTALLHEYGPGCLSGEPVFAPDPARTDEDAGWLLNFVHDTEAGESSLVILDAQAMERVATVVMPRRVPMGFHGNWMPTEG